MCSVLWIAVNDWLSLHTLTALESFHFFHSALSKVFGTDSSSFHVNTLESVHGIDGDVVAFLIIQREHTRRDSRTRLCLWLQDKGIRTNKEWGEKGDGTAHGCWSVFGIMNKRWFFVRTLAFAFANLIPCFPC